MKLTKNSCTCFIMMGIVFFLSSSTPAFADEGHSHDDKKNGQMEKMDGMKEMENMEHMHHDAPMTKVPEKIPGAKELRIDLKGPFCHKHPKDIQHALMELPGVKRVEAFSGRRYIIVVYKEEEVTAEKIAHTLDQLGGSGWRCDPVLSNKKSSER
ncbi:MAG: hypothetical protein ACE5FY_00260 [Nitrospiria bacterium]